MNSRRGETDSPGILGIDLSTPPGIIEHVGTTENVQDYESIRQALGYEKINFLGAS